MKEVLKELENMLEKDFCEKIVAEMEKTILMDRETINGKVLPWKVHDNDNLGPNKLLGGPSIWLYDLNQKYTQQVG